jgi:hypothetical protein
MNANDINNGLLLVSLAQELAGAFAKVVAVPGFGSATGVSDADLKALRLGEGVAQAQLAATIAAMPDDPPV